MCTCLEVQHEVEDGAFESLRVKVRGDSNWGMSLWACYRPPSQEEKMDEVFLNNKSF